MTHAWIVAAWQVIEVAAPGAREALVNGPSGGEAVGSRPRRRSGDALVVRRSEFDAGIGRTVQPSGAH